MSYKYLVLLMFSVFLSKSYAELGLKCVKGTAGESTDRVELVLKYQELGKWKLTAEVIPGWHTGTEARKLELSKSLSCKFSKDDSQLVSCLNDADIKESFSSEVSMIGKYYRTVISQQLLSRFSKADVEGFNFSSEIGSDKKYLLFSHQPISKSDKQDYCLTTAE